MARKIQERYLIQGTLTALTPLHVGGYGESVDTDLPLARDGADILYIPGTSLAGVLRNWCERVFGEEEINALWGFQKGEQGHASFVFVDDAPLPKTTMVEIRDGVGIDRVYGVAAEGIKYDRAVLPCGTSIPLKMTVEIEARRNVTKTHRETVEAFRKRQQRTQAIIGHLLTALEQEKIPLGAAHTRGLGRVRFGNFDVRCQRMNSRDGIFEVLEDHGSSVTIEELVNADRATQPQPQPWLEIAIRWWPRGPLMVKAGYEGIGVDMLPLVSARDGGVALVLPGSSIKGALRSQAERIVRTMLGYRATRQQFLKQLDQVPLVQELFGARTQHSERGATQTKRNVPQPGRGALAIADCYAKEHMSHEDWRLVEMAASQPDQSYHDQALWKAINTIHNKTEGRLQLAESQHVAIDRWTGGAAEGMLFNLLAPIGVTWEDMRFTLDFHRLPRDIRKPAVMLLLLILRDLMQHLIPIGFATHRGMGEVEVSEIQLRGTELDTDLVELADITLHDANFSALQATFRDRLTKAWAAWIENA